MRLKNIWSKYLVPLLLTCWALIILATAFTVFPGLIIYTDWIVSDGSYPPIGEWFVGAMPVVLLLTGVYWAVKYMYKAIKILKGSSNADDTKAD